jgi:hypothetical protein
MQIRDAIRARGLQINHKTAWKVLQRQEAAE